MNRRRLRRHERLDALLAQLNNDVRFALTLIEAAPPHSLTIDSETLTAVMARFAQQMQEARNLLQNDMHCSR